VTFDPYLLILKLPSSLHAFRINLNVLRSIFELQPVYGGGQIDRRTDVVQYVTLSLSYGPRNNLADELMADDDCVEYRSSDIADGH